MTLRGRPGVPIEVRLPATASETVNSAAFPVPPGALAMTIHCPTLAGSPATLTLETLDPGTDQETEVWRVVSAVAGVTAVPLTAIAASGVALTYDVRQTGGGVLRFVASSTQAVAPVTIKLTFHMQR